MGEPEGRHGQGGGQDQANQIAAGALGDAGAVQPLVAGRDIAVGQGGLALRGMHWRDFVGGTHQITPSR